MANSDLPDDLWSLCVVDKRLPNWLKIGVQAGFGPNFTVEFEAEIPKKFGLAYYVVTFSDYFFFFTNWPEASHIL